MQTANDQELIGTYVANPLDGITTQRLQYSEEVFVDFMSTIGVAETESSFRDALVVCQSQFAMLPADKQWFKRVFIFSTNDSPSKERPDELQSVRSVMKEMVSKEVEFEVFPLVFDKNKFSYSVFYSEFISSEIDEINYDQLEPAQKLEELNVRIKRKENKKRPLTRIDFQIDGVNKIGVKLYSLIKKFKKPGMITTDKQGIFLRRLIKTVSAETGREIEQEKVGTYWQLGDEKVNIDQTEIARLKNMCDISFVLIGFKPRTFLDVTHNIRESIFVVPDDERVTNSSVFSDALIREMIKKDQIAIVKVRLSKAASMRFGALLPQLESNQKGAEFVPNGFHLIILPWENEFREPEIESTGDVDLRPDEICVAQELVDSLTVENFDFRNFENPNIQRFFKIVQGLSLGLNEVIPPEDVLEPDYDQLDAKIDVLRRFNMCFFGQEEIDCNLNVKKRSNKTTKFKTENEEEEVKTEQRKKKIHKAEKEIKESTAKRTKKVKTDTENIPSKKDIESEPKVTEQDENGIFHDDNVETGNSDGQEPCLTTTVKLGNGMSLTVNQLKAVAVKHGIAIKKNFSKSAIHETIVEWLNGKK